MRIYFDTEFLEDGHTIDLISIGMVREDGAELYLINRDCDWRRVLANDWLSTNVVPKLDHPSTWVPKDSVAQRVKKFCTSDCLEPEFWAYYASYDWVALCQLFGRMIDLPKPFPMYCNDFKQLIAGTSFLKDEMPPGTEHNALVDARWLRAQHERFLAETQTWRGMGSKADDAAMLGARERMGR